MLLILCWVANSHCNKPDTTYNTGYTAGQKESPVFYPTETVPLIKDTQEINRIIKQCWMAYTAHPDSVHTVSISMLVSSKGMDYDLGIAKSYNLMGACYQEKMTYDTAIACYRQAFHYYTKAKAPAYAPANMQNVIGVCFESTGITDSAIRYYVQAIDLIHKSKYIHENSSQKVLTHSYANLANVITNSKGPVANQPQALAYYHKAMESASRLHDTSLIAKIHVCMANSLAPVNFDSSLRHFREGMRLNRLLRETVTMGETYRMLGSVYARKGNWDTAKAYWDTAMRYYAINNYDSPYYGDVLLSIGTYYVQTKSFPEAVRYFEKAEAIYQEQNTIVHNGATLYNNWATLDERMGNWKDAYQKKLIQDSINALVMNEKMIKTSQLMEARFRSMEKDKSLALLQNRLQKQYLGIGGLIALLIIISLTTIILLRRRKHKNEIAQLQAQRHGEEKERLRLAQELHDGIVSELSAIKMHLQQIPAQYTDMNEGKEDYNQIVHSLEHSISELRDTSHNLQPIILLEEGLLAAVHSFCSRLSKPGILDVTFIAMDALPPLTNEFQLNIYRIIQEVLNNITKHAALVTHIVVQINQAPGSSLLLISIEDNGLPQPNAGDHPEHKNGIGLYNLGKRIELLHGKMEQVRNNRGNAVYLEFDIAPYKKQAAQCV